jgi:hypothetical protein
LPRADKATMRMVDNDLRKVWEYECSL